MSDEYIKKSKAIADIKDYANTHTFNSFYKGMMKACEILAQVPPEDRVTWIPCSERLPSEKDYIGDVVIWCTDKSIVGVGWYYESTKSWATIDDTFPPILGEVIAWMPLPKPWKGADDE